MPRARLYLDEDVYHGVAVGLRWRGVDVVTTVEAGRTGSTDEQQLEFAVAEQRCLFTFNRGDFARLHSMMQQRGLEHSGIIVSPQRGIGAVVKNISSLLASHTDDDLRNRLIWLSSP